MYDRKLKCKLICCPPQKRLRPNKSNMATDSRSWFLHCVRNIVKNEKPCPQFSQIGKHSIQVEAVEDMIRGCLIWSNNLDLWTENIDCESVFHQLIFWQRVVGGGFHLHQTSYHTSNRNLWMQFTEVSLSLYEQKFSLINSNSTQSSCLWKHFSYFLLYSKVHPVQLNLRS